MKLISVIGFSLLSFTSNASQLANDLDFGRKALNEAAKVISNTRVSKKGAATVERIKSLSQSTLHSAALNSIKENHDLAYFSVKASDSQQATLDLSSRKELGKVNENASQEKVAVYCASGECDEQVDNHSDDFKSSAVQMGTLGSLASEERKTQAAIFTGRNITCRRVKAPQFINCCGKSSSYCSQGERQLALAKKEQRAAYAGIYKECADSVLGFCYRYEKKESWCVFKTKIAGIVQRQGRSQLGISFGSVGGQQNDANCRGLSPIEISSIQYDEPAIKNELATMANEYSSKGHFESAGQTSKKSESSIKHARSQYESINVI